jgi:hypothetical protein
LSKRLQKCKCSDCQKKLQKCTQSSKKAVKWLAPKSKCGLYTTIWVMWEEEICIVQSERTHYMQTGNIWWEIEMSSGTWKQVRVSTFEVKKQAGTRLTPALMMYSKLSQVNSSTEDFHWQFLVTIHPPPNPNPYQPYQDFCDLFFCG